MRQGVNELVSWRDKSSDQSQKVTKKVAWSDKTSKLGWGGTAQLPVLTLSILTEFSRAFPQSIYKKSWIIFMHGSLHRESNLITVQQDATYSVYYISVGSSKCFGCQHTKHLELPTEIQKYNKLNKSHFVGQLLNSNPGWYIGQATIASFQMLSNSSFTTLPSITLWKFDALTASLSDHRKVIVRWSLETIHFLLYTVFPTILV